MLIGKLEVFIFKEAIHEDDEFAHTGSDCDQWFFTCGSQTQVKGLEDGVMSDGAQSGHVQSAPNCAPAAANGTLSFLGATVTVIGSQACQRRGSLRVKLAQFGHFSQDRGGHHFADSWNGLQPAGFVSQLRILGDECGNGLVALIDLFFQKPEQLSTLAAAEGVGVMFGMVAFHGPQPDQLATALRPIRQWLLLGRNRQEGGWLEGLAVVGQDGGINGIGFGPLPEY